MSFDVLIRGGRVCDGTGNPWYRADVGIASGRIAAVGHLANARAQRTVDATDLVVTPGFIDVHTHSDFALFTNPTASSHVAQGITTGVIGNCGFSAFPRTSTNTGLLLDPKPIETDWSTAEEYFSKVRQRRFGYGIAALVGHSTIRAAVMGRDERAPTQAELAEMQAHVRRAMEAGATGVSSGLDYLPGSSATTDELVSLASVVAEYGGLYASHMRGYDRTAVEAVMEAIDIGRRARVAVQMSHLCVYGRENWGKGPVIRELVDRARAEGVDVTADILAYPTIGAWWGPKAIFPEDVYDWRQENETELAKLQARLRDPESRERLRAEVERRRTMSKAGPHGHHIVNHLIFSDWRDIFLEGVGPESGSSSYVGSSIAAIGEAQQRDPVDVYLDLVVSEGSGLNTVHIAESDDDYMTLLTAPWCMVSTDTIATSIERATESYNIFQQHPRGYGSYPRILQRSGQPGYPSFEESVRKMTSFPAARFGLRDRGQVQIGLRADLVVLSPERIAERGTYLKPKQHPAGVEQVLVDGHFALKDGALTDELAGQLVTAR